MLATNIPDFEIHVRESNGGDILTNCGNGFGCGEGMVGEVEGFDGGEEGGFAGVVQAEEEDGVFCWERGGVS